MRIAFFTDLYHPVISGLVENIETSAAALRKEGHEVFIVAPKSPSYKNRDPNVFLIPSIKYNRNPEMRLIVPLPDRTMTRLLAMDLDVIHGHAGGPTCFLGWEIARRKKIPYLLTYHTRFRLYTHYVFSGKLISPRMAQIGTRIAANLSTTVVAPTKAAKQELLSWGVKRPIEVIAGGIDLEKFKPGQKGFLREKYNIPAETIVLLYVGRIGIEKNIQFIIKAYAQISKKAENTVLFIVGDGPEKAKLQKLTRALKLSNKVIFTGFISMDKIAQAYADGDIFVFSSKTETQGLVISEAMSQGLPVVVIKDEAFEGIIVNGKTGFQTKGNIKDYSETVIKLLRDKSLRSRLGANGRKLILKEFSSKIQAQKLVKIYKAAVKEKSSNEESNKLLRSSILKLSVFLRMNQRLNRFKQLVRLPRW